MISFLHYIAAPGALLLDTIAGKPAAGMARFGAWCAYLICLSGVLPLVVGYAAVWFGYFEPDDDAAAAIDPENYPAKHVALRAQRTSLTGEERPPLVLPSPEPSTSPR